MTRSARAVDEAGSALIELSWLAILLLVPLVYVITSVFDVQRAAYGVTAATRAAGQAYVLSPTSRRRRRVPTRRPRWRCATRASSWRRRTW